jgi:hypothetical protein
MTPEQKKGFQKLNYLMKRKKFSVIAKWFKQYESDTGKKPDNNTGMITNEFFDYVYTHCLKFVVLSDEQKNKISDYINNEDKLK